jgi:hypothetical protein
MRNLFSSSYIEIVCSVAAAGNSLNNLSANVWLFAIAENCRRPSMTLYLLSSWATGTYLDELTTTEPEAAIEALAIALINLRIEAVGAII